jgi:hypothetical protein
VLLVVANATAALILVGIIWTIQVVHYPLFAQVGGATFAAYSAAHATRITALIALPWAVQGLATLGLIAATPAGVPVWLAWSAAVLAAVPVLVTVAMSVPAHRRLADGFDPVAHARLVATNWLRTLAWSAHAAVAVAILLLALRAG